MLLRPHPRPPACHGGLSITRPSPGRAVPGEVTGVGGPCGASVAFGSCSNQADTFVSSQRRRELGVRTSAVHRVTQPRPWNCKVAGPGHEPTVRVSQPLCRRSDRTAAGSRRQRRAVRTGEPCCGPSASATRSTRASCWRSCGARTWARRRASWPTPCRSCNFDQEQLAKMSDAASAKGAMSDARLRLQERNVEADLTAVARAERTLRVWRLPESEIQAVKDEARADSRAQGPAAIRRRRRTGPASRSARRWTA